MKIASSPGGSGLFLTDAYIKDISPSSVIDYCLVKHEHDMRVTVSWSHGGSQGQAVGKDSGGRIKS